MPGATYKAAEATVKSDKKNRAGFFLPSESLSGPAAKNPIAAPKVTAESEYCTKASGTSKNAAIFG